MRALKQYLADLQRAGLTHIPTEVAEELLRASAAANETAGKHTTQSAQTPARPRAATPPSAQAEVSTPEPPAAPPAKTTPQRDESLFPSPPPTLEPVSKGTLFEEGERAQRCTLTANERQVELARWAQQVAGCTRCAELCESRTQTVFGVGHPSADVMFIGEAPGQQEDATGVPFVGPAGQLLDKMIGACRLKREEIYICNILRCRPPGNRNPRPDEAANCREYLDAQIRLVDPDWIVCFGTVAAQNLLGVETSIGRMRQKEYRYGAARVVCTYHPSYLLRNESAKKKTWDDLKLWRRQMGVEL